MAVTTITVAPSQQQPVVDQTGRATWPWYRWFTQIIGEALNGVVTDVLVAPPLSSSGTTSGGTSGVITLGLNPSGVTPGTYGDATHVAQVTVNAQGIVTAAVPVAISGGGGGGTATPWMPVHVGGLAVSVGRNQVAVGWTVPVS